MTNKDECREAFERFVTDKYEADLDKADDGEYFDIELQQMYESWLYLWRIRTQPHNHATIMGDRATFWKAEYCSLARAGVEKMAELGIEVDPAEKMIEAAEYRESRTKHPSPTTSRDVCVTCGGAGVMDDKRACTVCMGRGSHVPQAQSPVVDSCSCHKRSGGYIEGSLAVCRDCNKSYPATSRDDWERVSYALYFSKKFPHKSGDFIDEALAICERNLTKGE